MLKEWRVIIALDRPSDRVEGLLKKFFHDNLLAHNWQAKWPVHKDVGGDFHFIVVNCEPSEATVLGQQLLYLIRS